MPERLAIAIPTYCRVGALASNLPPLLEEAEKLGVGVYVSDDSPDNETALLAGSLVTRFPHLRYRHNAPPLRHDANILSTMKWPDAEYVWILGDVFRPKAGELANICGLIQQQDLLFLNHNDTKSDESVIECAAGDQARILLADKLWHQTLTGATIYSQRVISWAERNLGSTHENFPQLDVILGYAESNPIKIGWLGRRALHAEIRHKSSSYWRARGIDVFVDDWVSVVCAYPKAINRYDLKNVLRSHSESTNLFDFRYLRELSRSGNFKISSLAHPHFWDVMHIPKVMVILSLTPNPLSKMRAVLKKLLARLHSFQNKNN